VAWTALTPPLQGPDELDHVAYVQHLAETGHAPNREGGTGSLSTELATVAYGLNLAPTRGHLDGRTTWSEIGPISQRLARITPAERKDGSGPNPQAQNPPLDYVLEAVVYRISPDSSLLARLTLMRLFSVALFVVTVGLAWLLAVELFARPWMRVLTVVPVALHPKLASIAGCVNPDILLVTISTGFALAATRLLNRGPSVPRVTSVALLAGAGALTHGRGLFLAPVAVLAIVVALWRAQPGRRVAARLAGMGALAFAVPVIAALAWTRSSSNGTGAYGGEIGQNVTQSLTVRGLLSYAWQFFFPRLSFMTPKPGPAYGYRQAFIETFFGGWANFEVNFQTSTYDLLQVGCYIGLLALILTVAARWKAVTSKWPVVALAVAMVASLVGLLIVASYRDLQQGGSPLITGRYLLPLIALYGAAIAWVIGSLPRRVALIGAGLVVGASVLLGVQGFLVNLERFYG
jgi:hypothetical protein